MLVSRESARLLERALQAVIAGAEPPGGATESAPVTVDFAGVEGITPSFLDELVSIFESVVGESPEGRRLIVAHPPTRLSLKFEAVARGHGMSARVLPDGSWVLADARGSRP
jgi:hypothetical protein